MGKECVWCECVCVCVRRECVGRERMCIVCVVKMMVTFMCQPCYSQLHVGSSWMASVKVLRHSSMREHFSSAK